jgi:hypothetical protein
MSTASGVLLIGWLVAALAVLAMDRRLPAFLAVAVPATLLLLGVGGLVHQQRALSRYNQPLLPERYRVADDLRQPIGAVVAAAEQDATTPGWR